MSYESRKEEKDARREAAAKKKARLAAENAARERAISEAGSAAISGHGNGVLTATGSQEAGSAALSGPGNGVLTAAGSQEARAGAAEGLQLGQLLYGQGMGDIGADAKDYSDRVKGGLDRDYAQADVYRNNANRRIAQSANNIGMAGATMGGAREQLYRQSGMQSEAMNQDYRDKALGLYGKNISAKQSGMSGLYFSGKGEGQANTPTPVASSSGGMSIICTELFYQGKITEREWKRASLFGLRINRNTYDGYLTIAKPVVKLMKKSDKFSGLFIGWSKSIAENKPNLITRLLMPICFMVGYARSIKKEKSVRETV